MPSTAHTRVDLHFHVLPGVDDGPATLEHSLRIARLAVRDGTRLAVATPHVRSDHLLSVDQLHERVRTLQHELDRERIELRLLPGAELGHEMVACLSDGALQTIAQGPPGRRWILLEAPFDGLTEDFHEAADELRTRGFGVLMAHPERMAGIAAADDRALAHELKRGTLLQVKREVKVTVFAQDRSTGFNAYRDLLDSYRQTSDKLNVEYVDPERRPGVARQYGVTRTDTAVLESGSQVKVSRSYRDVVARFVH